MADSKGTVLVAGATGALGRHVISALKSRGYRTRALGRTGRTLGTTGADETRVADALAEGALDEAVRGCDVVFSCLGASVDPSRGGRASFARVDVPANCRLVDAAKRAKVRRFVYVSVHRAKEHLELEYMRAHEDVVLHLATSGLDWAVVRPTGFFSSLAPFVARARRGPLPLFGSGDARSNPVHEADLAEACVDAVAGGPRERDVGGPEVLTRRQIAALACAAAGVPLRVRRIPLAFAWIASLVIRPFHPRLAHLLAFVGVVMNEDFVAPAVGTRTLGDYWKVPASATGSGKAVAARG
jgi:uncharacterized protein YbjT (DUF2867 family)